jgi:hypothetical protein
MQHRLHNDLETAHFKSGFKGFYVPGKGYTFGWGLTVPTGEAGWSTGAIFNRLTGDSLTTLYCNHGDAVSAFWDPTGPEFTAISAASITPLIAANGLKLGLTGDKVGMYGFAPVVQPVGANQAALTDSTGGSVDGTLADGTGTYSQSIFNNNFADVASRINAIRTALVAVGVMKGAA